MNFGLPTVTNTFKTPADSTMKLAMRMYEPYITHFIYSSQSDPTINISIEGRAEQIIVHNANINGAFVDLGKERETNSDDYEVSVTFDEEFLNEIQRQTEEASPAYEQTTKEENE
jgi:hypothetical protein